MSEHFCWVVLPKKWSLCSSLLYCMHSVSVSTAFLDTCLMAWYWMFDHIHSSPTTHIYQTDVEMEFAELSKEAWIKYTPSGAFQCICDVFFFLLVCENASSWANCSRSLVQVIDSYQAALFYGFVSYLTGQLSSLDCLRPSEHVLSCVLTWQKTLLHARSHTNTQHNSVIHTVIIILIIHDVHWY